MRKEAITVLRILAKNQKTRNTGKWKAYMIMPVSVHQYHCPATRFGQKHGSCTCGAVELQKEFEEAWKKFKSKIQLMTRMLAPGKKIEDVSIEQEAHSTVTWRKVWKEFKRWVDETTVGAVPWPVQKRKIQSLVQRYSRK